MLREPADLTDRLLYTYPEVDRILDLGAGTARRWIDGYDRAGVAYDPVVRSRSTEAPLVTWGEFIEVYYLARFRRSGIPLQRLRATLHAARVRTGSHYLFAHDEVLYADPERLEVIHEIQEEYEFPTFLVVRTGQLELAIDPDARQRLERITYDQGVAIALRPRLDIDHVVVQAGRFFGKPRIVDTGISPGAVARLVRSGTPLEVVSELYDLQPSIIDEAGRFTYGDGWASAA